MLYFQWLIVFSRSFSSFIALSCQVNHKKPSFIFVFRDGVSDSQLRVVKEFEVPQFKECFHNFPDYNPKLVVIVVQKRINQRIFAKTVRTISLTAAQFFGICYLVVFLFIDLLTSQSLLNCCHSGQGIRPANRSRFVLGRWSGADLQKNLRRIPKFFLSLS